MKVGAVESIKNICMFNGKENGYKIMVNPLQITAGSY